MNQETRKYVLLAAAVVFLAILALAALRHPKLSIGTIHIPEVDQLGSGMGPEAEVELTSGRPAGVSKQVDARGLAQQLNRTYQVPSPSEDPNFGTFASKAELEYFLVSMCTISARSGGSPSENLSEWVRDRTYWDYDGQKFEHVPLTKFTKQHVDSEVLAAVQGAEDQYREQLEHHAKLAHLEFGLAAEEYVSRGVPVVARDQEYDKYGAHFQREVGHITAFTTVGAGAWTYVVDFNSADFPELELQMEKIQELMVARESHVKVILEQAGLTDDE